jgi:hypothetical protein
MFELRKREGFIPKFFELLSVDCDTVFLQAVAGFSEEQVIFLFNIVQ